MEQALQSGASAALVPGISPQLYDEADFQRIAALVKAEAGIILSARKKMLAYSRIAPLVRRSGLQTFGQFLDTLDSDREQRREVIASLTTNHTYFNREPHHFEHFAQSVRPDLVARAEVGEPIRLWSAGCSSGEEVYTLMMVLLGADQREGRRIANKPIVALASDLAQHAVAAATQATYPADALAKLPPQLRETWCEPAAGARVPSLAIREEVRAMIRFRRLNLLRPWPFRTTFDVIFCRNVMIYFDDPTKAELVLRFAQRLRPGGFLYIGHSERVAGEATRLLEPVGPTIYRRVGA
jgi:chemotaxis protein methyltransferase CheR